MRPPRGGRPGGRSPSVVVESKKKRRFTRPGEGGAGGTGAAAGGASSGAAAAASLRSGSSGGQVAQSGQSGGQTAPDASGGQGATARGGQGAPRGAPNRSGPPNRSGAPQRGRSAPGGGRGGRQQGGPGGGLSTGEMDARRRALAEAQVREVEDRKRAVVEAERRQREEELARQRAAEEAEIAARDAAERASREAEETKRKAAEDARRAKEEAQASDAGEPAADRGRSRAPDKKPALKRFGPSGQQIRPAKPEAAKPARTRGDGEDRRRNKLTLNNALADRSRTRSLASMRRRQEKQRRGSGPSTPRERVMRNITVPDTITIQELANRMTERAVDVVKIFMAQGQMMTPGDIIDADMAQLVAEEMGHTVTRVSEADIEVGIFDRDDDEGDLAPRPPVVTIMGHVDHGKTSLLDAIRKARVAAGEAGGITQHIGAYQIERDGNLITFLDTPGHAAFTAMRARGAEVTDIAILVVAADDGVMPQTIESISHAKAAGVPIIVAINKMDMPGADPSRVRNELLQHEVFVESMGGEVLDVEVSAKTGDGIDQLLETITLQAELLELTANPGREAEGIVVESKLEKGRGAVATIIVQAGTLKRGDIVVAGDEWGKVRALVNDSGQQQPEAGPSTPVEVLGLNGAPAAGDRLGVVENEARAREISEYRQRLTREKQVAAQAGSRGSLEQMMSDLQSKGTDEAQFVIKADTHGSAEAIRQSLEDLGTDEVAARIVHSAVGGITEADVTLAIANKTPIIAFNVRPNAQAKAMAQREGIEIRYYSVIYDLIDDVRNTLSGMLAPERRETFIGYAEILQLFTHSKVGKVAGCLVTEGRVERGAGVRLLRDDVVVHEGELKTLKRFKDEVAEVQSGTECGMAFKNYQDMRVGDRIECFTVELIERKLEEAA